MNTTTKAAALSAIILTAACSDVPDTLRPADYADAGTTALAIANGASEMNPIVGFAGDGAAPVVALGLKYGLRKGLAETGAPQEGVDAIMDGVGWIGTCNNLAVLAGVSFPASLGYGAVCGAVSAYLDRDAFEGVEE